MKTKTKCKNGGKHEWQPDGGMAENPGVFDNGTGGLRYAQVCAKCGSHRVRGKDYTGHRPGNTFNWRYTFAGE